ncbi:hypothetical protein DV096_20465 [Bradymonadaceae bacterium TMQ3]|nr:hypothetical protein DV096_20465 [Bradymonadaceae bacterium TMQ3]
MTRPRRHVADQVVALTRRTVEGRFFTRPDANINAVAAYEFARSASRSGVVVHGAVVMSNHVHIVLTDPQARRSDFMRDAMAGFTRARNNFFGRTGSLWDTNRSYCDTVLLDREVFEIQLLYVLLNPVKAGLVRRAKDWPGFKIMPSDWEKPMLVERPAAYYGDDQPEFFEFIPRRPPGYDAMTLEEVVAHFEKRLREAENEIHRQMKKQRRRFLGVKGVLATEPLSCAKEKRRRREVAPRYAAYHPGLLDQAIVRERAFRSAYAQVRERWVQGKKRCVFPNGTLWLRRNAPVKCREHDPWEAGLAANYVPHSSECATGVDALAG